MAYCFIVLILFQSKEFLIFDEFQLMDHHFVVLKQGPLIFHIDFTMSLSLSIIKPVGMLSGIALNL